MIYNEFKGLKLSALGMGCMRLPKYAEADDAIDIAQVEKMVETAMKGGINYYDTAWGYHNGASETVMGKVLSKYPRESFYLATKFPGYDLGNMGKAKEIFAKQLEKLQTEYFDFYLIHNINEININAYLDESFGDVNYCIGKKNEGVIRHLGFSCHGAMDTFKRFLDKYGEYMEFCQLQLNWLDWDFQDVKSKVALLEKLGIAVWVMEPLRGGKLVNLSEKDVEMLNALRPNETIPAWSFRFAQSLPQVKMTLSGMSNLEQVEQNLKTYETNAPLNDEEMQALFTIAKSMTAPGSIPCTGCRYCVTHCPPGLNIPKLLGMINEHTFSNGGYIPTMLMESMTDAERPSACLKCGSCMTVCPQNIDIPGAFAAFMEKFNKQ